MSGLKGGARVKLIWESEIEIEISQLTHVQKSKDVPFFKNPKSTSIFCENLNQ